MNFYKRRLQTKKFLNQLIKDQHKTLVIHYSCESLTDNNEGYSPRITSIAVQSLRGDFQKSFSIHLEAEKSAIPREDIQQHYNKLELKMLDRFYLFSKEYVSRYWLNWKMKNINFGFEAIEHRYEVLGGQNFIEIPTKQRVDVSSIFVELYGDEYIEPPEFYNLLGKNFNNEHPDLLPGSSEVEAFDNKEFVKMHKSTLVKTNKIAHLIRLANDNKLKVSKKNLLLFIEERLAHPLLGVLGLIGVILSIVSGIGYLVSVL